MRQQQLNVNAALKEGDEHAARAVAIFGCLGRTCEYPPPAAPPLTPKTGPIEGSRMTQNVRSPSRESAWLRPMVVTVLPSPKGVGLTPVTSTSEPRFWSPSPPVRDLIADQRI